MEQDDNEETEEVTPSDLATSLLRDRFQGDEVATVRFLVEAIDSLPNAAESKRLVLREQQEPTAADYEVPDIGDIVVDKISVSCTQPRGRLDLTVGSTALLFSKDDATLFTIQGKISHCIFFPKPSDCRKRYKEGAKLPPDMVLLVLSSENDEESSSFTYKKKTYTQVCFQLPDNKGDDNSNESTDLWSNRLSATLSIATTERVLHKNNPVFASYQDNSTSSTNAGLPFVNCYHHVMDGSLYCLESGLLFFGRNCTWVARETMASLQAVAGNRYVTLSVTLDNTDTSSDDDGGEEENPTQLEFTNIDKVENDGIQQYIRQKLVPAMQRDVDATSSVARLAEDKSDEDDDDDGDDSERRGRKRKAASQARSINKRAVKSTETQVDDDDDDDDDDEEEDQTYEQADNESDDDEGDTESEEEYDD